MRASPKRFGGVSAHESDLPGTPPHQAKLETLVRRIVKAWAAGGDMTALEAEVNERVYRLFGLTRDEIAIIEES